MVHVITVKSLTNGAVTRLVYTNKRVASHDEKRLKQMLAEQESKADVKLEDMEVAPERNGPETQRARMLMNILYEEVQEDEKV